MSTVPLGGVVVERAPSARHAGADVVLVRIDDPGHTSWVTWIHSSKDGGYHWGHYTEIEADARADFLERRG